jgi:hypothetical protein
MALTTICSASHSWICKKNTSIDVQPRSNTNPFLEWAGPRAAGPVRHLLQILDRDVWEASRSSGPHALRRGLGGSIGHGIGHKVVTEVPRAVLVAVSVLLAAINSLHGDATHIVTVGDKEADRASLY